jgi:hypothetical protein
MGNMFKNMRQSGARIVARGFVGLHWFFLGCTNETDRSIPRKGAIDTRTRGDPRNPG